MAIFNNLIKEHNNKAHNGNNGYVCEIDDGGYAGYLNHIEAQYKGDNSVSVFADRRINLTRLLDYLPNVRPIKNSPWEYSSLDDIISTITSSMKMEGVTVIDMENNDEGVSIHAKDDERWYHISYESDSPRKSSFSILRSDGRFVDMVFTKELDVDFQEFLKRVV